MSGPTIIIAEKNHLSRTRMALAFAERNHFVKTTGSAAYLMQNLLHGGLSVVVLGVGLYEGLSLTTLIQLLKSCDPHSTIILVSDDVSPTEEVKVRQQGIFYRTNRPICALGWDELQQAVDCACNKIRLRTTPFRSH